MTWDNVCERVCTWAILKRKKDEKIITVFNTHWDHRGQESRIKSVDLILERLKPHLETQVILMGDFNATETNPALKKLTAAKWTNAFLSQYEEGTNRGTFHSWNGKSSATGTIDHIFLLGDAKVKKAWIERHHSGTQWPSDHFPVAAILSE
jgi:endonuclease/exonuclease/phosphatase family metal-dependent hydrolase